MGVFQAGFSNHMRLTFSVSVNTVRDFVLNAERDQIECIFWSLKEMEEDEGALVDEYHNYPNPCLRFRRECRANVQTEDSELDMINALINTIQALDSDILAGWEVNSSPWGYVIKRAKLLFKMNLCDDLSRFKMETHSRFGNGSNLWGFNTGSSIKITGRHMVNIWRAVTAELNLLGYSVRCCVSLIASEVIDHMASKVQLDLEILDRQELITRTSEGACLLGIDFASVDGRGSQFKVESMMFRIAKPESFILVSSSRAQVRQRNALECLPQVMEPFSRFYTSPVVVPDFQSLYPSVMIAHDYCYSTFLGRITPSRSEDKMGFTRLHRPPRLL
ncbi:ribonuclease H-like domain-containing protein [Tuber brumale]|nr:ribonuclease H-like domain-containing protein [Tuber brumale]